MNIRNSLFTTFVTFLTMGVCQNVLAENIYQWTDEDGNIYFSDVSPDNSSTMMAYTNSISEKAYQWKDSEGNVHFSDAQPNDAITVEINELEFDQFDENTADAEKYSIVNQADRMRNYRLQLIEEREDRERAKLEQYRIAQEQEILRMEEQLRKQGYGPKPYYYPYNQMYY